MQVTLLGTGSALPTGDRYQTGVVVDAADRDGPLLVDCGAGVLQRLAQAGYGPEDVAAVLLTHHHLDHVADLPSLLKARWLRGLDDDGSSDVSCPVVGPPGTRDYLAPLLGVDQVQERADPVVEEHREGPFSVAGYDVATCETVHSAPGFAYRIDDRLVISGDTEATERIARFADGAAVLVHDCAYADEDRTGHATPRRLGETLAAAGTDVERLYLTHLYPAAAADATTVRETVAAHVDADVRVASDLDRVSIGDG